MSLSLGRYNILTSYWSETGFRPTCYDEFPQNWHKRNAYRYPIPVSYVEGGEQVSKRVKVYFGSQVRGRPPEDRGGGAVVESNGRAPSTLLSLY